VIQETVGSEPIFREINSENKMEGGPKGIAIHNDTLAVCSPQYGVKIYRFSEFD
jgi:type IV secretory pathway TrbD component